MSEEPFYIVLKNVKEHENGDATYTFDMSDKARDSIIEEGLTLMLYCGIAKVDIQDVYDWILNQDSDDTIWVDFNDDGAVIAGGKGTAEYEGEHTYIKKVKKCTP
jgi:TATA-binding protein-associated factor Taf7